MNKIANYKEMIYKEASAVAGNIIPADYSRVKHIDLGSDEFRTISSRDMRMHEKAGEGVKKAVKGAKNTAKNVKQVAENIKGATPLQKALLGSIAAGATIGAAGLAYEGHELLKSNNKKKDTKADKSRDKDVASRLMRDGVTPDMKRNMAIMPTRTALGLVMLKPTLKLTAEGGKQGARLAHKLTNGNAGAALAGSVIGNIAGASIAGMPVMMHDVALLSYQEAREMDRLKKRYFGEGITKEEAENILRTNIKEKMTKGSKKLEVKPESIEEQIQRRRREEKKEEEKKASDYLDMIYKEAKEKWTKEDKKGYIRNVAISTAQDFMNAGNPLNLGSSVVGSVLDSAILEKASLNLNKKLKSNKVSQDKVDGFNKAVEVKNGVALPHAAANKLK